MRGGEREQDGRKGRSDMGKEELFLSLSLSLTHTHNTFTHLYHSMCLIPEAHSLLSKGRSLFILGYYGQNVIQVHHAAIKFLHRRHGSWFMCSARQLLHSLVAHSSNTHETAYNTEHRSSNAPPTTTCVEASNSALQPPSTGLSHCLLGCEEQKQFLPASC